MRQKKARTLSITSTYHPHNGLHEDKMTEFYDTATKNTSKLSQKKETSSSLEPTPTHHLATANESPDD
jgi:hypothetical protein